MKPALVAVFLLSAALAAACASTPESGEHVSSARKAAETNTALGRRYMDRRQYEVALEKLKRAVAQDPTYAPAHTLLGVLYETLGMKEDAGREYRLALKHDPDDGDVNNNYAVFLCGQGEAARAEPLFEAAVEDPFYTTRHVAYANAGKCALDTGNLDKAEKYLRQSLEYDGKYPPALLLMAEVSYRKEAYLPARAFLQRFEAVGPANAPSLLLGFRIESALGDADAAERYRRDLLSGFSESAEAAETRKLN